MIIIYCEYCGNEIEDSAKFCTYCGCKIDIEPEGNQDDVISDVFPADNLNETKENENPIKIPLLIIGIVLAAVAVGFAVWWFFIKEDTRPVVPLQNTSAETVPNDEEAVKPIESPTIAFYSSVLMTEWPGNYRMGSFNVLASSVLPDQGSCNYQPRNVLDNNARTAWVESAADDGVGESISLVYSGNDPFSFTQINFMNGYTKDRDTFNKNGAPTKVCMQKNSETLAEIQLYAELTPQKVILPNPVVLEKNDRITFVIENVFVGPSDGDHDTAISEISFQ